MNSKLPYAKRYKELVAYKISMELADKVFQSLLTFPSEEKYSLTDQIRRSSRSIGAQIAEAWGKRPYVKHFISKLTDAYSEVYETEHWIEVAYRCGYLTQIEKLDYLNQCISICQLLGGMMSKADQFYNKA
jgi:four helix bundle protein